MSRKRELILKMELLPHHVRGHSIREALGWGRWQKVRASLIQERGLRCETCAEVPQRKVYLQVHEIWEHSAKGSTLIDLRLLCWFCHACQHYDMYAAGGIQGVREDASQRIKEHYCRINGVSGTAFEAHFKKALQAAFSVNIAGIAEIDYGIYAPLMQQRQEAQQKWLQTRVGEMRVIQKFLDRHRREFDEDKPEKHDFHPDDDDWIVDDDDWIVDVARDHEETRQELASHLNARNYATAREMIVEILSELRDDGFEMLPDHECPEATAMWNDAFG
jgi:hypothetical protein